MSEIIIPKITENQRVALGCLVEFGGYWYSTTCGWTMGNNSKTVLVMEALSRKGLAYRDRQFGTQPCWRATSLGIYAEKTKG